MPYFVIGKIVNTHGVRGELRVFPTTDDISRFDLLDWVTVRHKGELHYNIEGVRYHKNMVLLKLEGIDSMDAAAALKGGELVIPEHLALPLEDNEYYARDLFGLAVKDEDGTNIGRLSDILSSGGGDVYAVSREGAKDVLIPAVRQFIISVDIAGGVMTVRLPEGLIE